MSTDRVDQISKPPHSATLPPLLPCIIRYLNGLLSEESLHEGCTIAYARPLRGSAWDGIKEATSLRIQRIFIFDRTPPTHRQPTKTVTEVRAPLLEGQPAPLQVAVDAFGLLDGVVNNGALTMLLASNLSGRLICFSWRA